MYDYLVKGGIVMVPILLCSVVSLSVFLERLWSLRSSHMMPRALVRKADEMVRSGEVERALALCSRTKGPLLRIMQAALQNAGFEREAIKEAVQEVGRREAARLERYSGVLGTVANVSTLLGLLGTVSGMIKGFNIISLQGAGNPALLAASISEALVTTAAGLSVAIPSFLAYRYFLSRVDRAVLEWEEVGIHFVDLVKRPKQGAGQHPVTVWE